MNNVFQQTELCEILENYPLFFIPISYVIYRLTRTILAFAQAVFLYWILPIFYSPNLSKFANRWTVITGGTDGIGKAYMIELAKRGCKNFLLIGRSQHKLDNVQMEIEKKYPGTKVDTFLFDFDSDDYSKLRDRLSGMNIGLAVNSVGVGRQYLERFGERPETDSQILRVNGLGASEFVSAVLPPMNKSGGGQIVNLSSSQGVRPIALLAAYSASKSMLSFISEAVDREYDNINVQCLTPALVATNMTYYKKVSLFVVSPENFARQAVSILGVVHRTSGCFNHEIQMLMQHLLPWCILKHLIMPIYWLQQKRMVKLHGPVKKRDIYNDCNQEVHNGNSAIERTSEEYQKTRCSRIPTSSSVRSRACLL